MSLPKTLPIRFMTTDNVMSDMIWSGLEPHDSELIGYSADTLEMAAEDFDRDGLLVPLKPSRFLSHPSRRVRRLVLRLEDAGLRPFQLLRL